MDGRALTFRLAGINNQNFLMRDEETGTYWQQISGLAIAGPLKGRRLELVHSDEITFGLWRGEHPNGTVLQPVAKFAKDYEPKDWEKQYAKLRVVTKAGKNEPLEPRRLVFGIANAGGSRAFPVDKVLAETLVLDAVGGEPVLLVTGPDKVSIRAFSARIDGVSEAAEFYRRDNGLMLDSVTGSEWNFQGCAVSGAAKGKCLRPVDGLRDYWFDWKIYHPDTTVYRH